MNQFQAQDDSLQGNIIVGIIPTLCFGPGMFEWWEMQASIKVDLHELNTRQQVAIHLLLLERSEN